MTLVPKEIGSQGSCGPDLGAELTPYRHLDTFWFAWVSFHPDTELLGSTDREAGS